MRLTLSITLYLIIAYVKYNNPNNRTGAYTLTINGFGVRKLPKIYRLGNNLRCLYIKASIKEVNI